MCISICPLSSSKVAPKTKQSRVTLIIPILDQPIGSHPPTKISRAPSSPPKTCGQKIRAMNNQGFSNAQVQGSMGDLPAASALRSTTSASSFVKYVSPPRTAESQQVTRVPDRKSPRKTRPQEFFGCLLMVQSPTRAMQRPEYDDVLETTTPKQPGGHVQRGVVGHGFW